MSDISAVSATKLNHEKRDSIFFLFVKRAVDLLVSLLVMPAFALVFLLTAIAVKCTDRGPVLYRAERIGKDGKTFCMYKFRSMKVDGDKMLSDEERKQLNLEYKLENDPRVTGVGRFLRKTSLDELPQFLNVIKNDMSLIGPRPVTQAETQLFGADRDRLLSIKPGITGYWQAYARNNVGYQDGKRQKMELYYVENRSLRLDFKIFFMTIKRVFTANGVY